MTKPASSIPTVPRMRSLMNSFKFVVNPIPYIDESIAKVGDTYKMFMGGFRKGLVTRDPEIIQHVLQKNHRKYSKSRLQTETIAKYVGHGLLTSEGDYWLRQRRLIQPGFHRAKLAALVNTMNQVIDQFILQMDQVVERDSVLQLDQFMMELTFQIVAKTLFSTAANEEELRTLAEDITLLQEFIIKEVRQPFMVPFYHLTGKIKKHKKIAKEAQSIILNVIQDRKNSGEKFDDLLDMLLSARYEDSGEGMSDKQLLEESLILFVAGHETTANAMSWAPYLLTRHPEVVEKMRNEIKQVLGDREPAFEDLPKLQYVHQVIQESMRLYPPAWVTDRVALEDDEINGVAIPKDTMVIIYIYGAHHSDKLWDQPEQFRPERFAKENIKSKPAFAYMPFGGGPRLCIGNNFAMMEMQLALTKMVRRFDFQLVPGQVINAYPMVTLRPRYGIKMKLKYAGN